MSLDGFIAGPNDELDWLERGGGPAEDFGFTAFFATVDALLVGRRVEAVLALGEAAEEAWGMWKATPAAAAVDLPFAAVTHPTQPESSAGGDRAKLAEATKKLLRNWNVALQGLGPAIRHPDGPRSLVLYGDAWGPGDRLPVPQADFPAGLPSWMGEEDGENAPGFCGLASAPVSAARMSRTGGFLSAAPPKDSGNPFG